MQKLIIRITQENTNLIADSNLQCFILPDSLPQSFIADFCAKAKTAEKLVLLSGEKAADLYLQKLGDGLIVDTSKDENPTKHIKEIKAKCKKSLLGVICRNRRHEAMLVSECEPDFIIFRFWKDGFAANSELLKWYSEFFLIQSAIQPEDEVDTSNLSADFVILSDDAYTIFVAK